LDLFLLSFGTSQGRVEEEEEEEEFWFPGTGVRCMDVSLFEKEGQRGGRGRGGRGRGGGRGLLLVSPLKRLTNS
jgi:hypothetical protein